MEQRNLIGETILGYEVVAQIGSGAFGTVYKAVKSNALGEYVRALKHISLPTKRQYASVLNSMGGDAEKADNYFAEMLNGIASEISLLSTLSEKRTAHIVRYFESDLETHESPLRYDIYMLMEYATPLLDYIEQGPGFTVRDVMNVGIDVLEGIRVCHENGVIHRDIKEDNIFVSSDGNYEIGDFGVSKVLKDSSRAESLKGTPNYLAPEVYLNKGGYTKSVDLYALGIVLYRLLNHGRNPFMPPFPQSYFAEDEDAAFERRMRGLSAEPPALGSDQIHRVILKAIAAEGARYQDAESFIADLDAALSSAPSHVLDEQIGYSATGATGGAQTAGQTAPTQETIRVAFDPLQNNKNYQEPEEANDPWEAPAFDSEPAAVPDDGTSADDGLGSDPVVDNANDTNGAYEPYSAYDPYDPDDQSAEVESTQRYRGAGGAVQGNHGRGGYEVVRSGEKQAKDRSSIIVLGVVFIASAVMALVTASVNQAISALGAVLAFASLVGALYFIGHSMHGRGEASAAASLVDKEPQQLASEAKFAFAATAEGSSDAEMRRCLNELERLEERLGSEQKFGYGNGQVTICENEIADCLERISASAPSVTGRGRGLSDMREKIREVNHLLDRRRALMTR